MGPAGLTAVFGMGTGVTPPVWSPENRPAGCQATPAAIPRWSVTGTWSSRHTRSSGTSARTKTNPLSAGVCPLSSASRHSDRIGEATGSPWLAVVPWHDRTESRSGWSSCLAVRTGRLRRSPAVHARPIDLVVFQEPTHDCWKPHLGGGFALRCLQRLSSPDLATRRCPERDSRHTRGRSSPILSY